MVNCSSYFLTSPYPTFVPIRNDLRRAEPLFPDFYPTAPLAGVDLALRRLTRADHDVRPAGRFQVLQAVQEGTHPAEACGEVPSVDVGPLPGQVTPDGQRSLAAGAGRVQVVEIMLDLAQVAKAHG